MLAIRVKQQCLLDSGHLIFDRPQRDGAIFGWRAPQTLHRSLQVRAGKSIAHDLQSGMSKRCAGLPLHAGSRLGIHWNAHAVRSRSVLVALAELALEQHGNVRIRRAQQRRVRRVYIGTARARWLGRCSDLPLSLLGPVDCPVGHVEQHPQLALRWVLNQHAPLRVN